MSGVIQLRPVTPSDFDVFYAHQTDPVAYEMVGMLPRERAAFDEHWTTALRDPSNVLRAILVDERLVWSIGSFIRDGRREVFYWIDRAYWRQGIATASLRLLLQEVGYRPMYGRVAKDHTASQHVLLKCGFAICGEDKCFANAIGKEIEEWILELRD